MTLPLVPPPLFGSKTSLLFFQDAAPVYFPPTDRGGWTNSPDIQKKLGIAPAGASAVFNRTEAGGSSSHTDLMFKWVTNPLLEPVTISGNFSLCVGAGGTETNAGLRIYIYVTQGSADVVRGTLLTATNWSELPGGSTYEGIEKTNIAFTGSVNALAGDHVVMEMGITFTNSAGVDTNSIYYGNTGPILLTDGDNNVTTRLGWFRFLNSELALAP